MTKLEKLYSIIERSAFGRFALQRTLVHTGYVPMCT